MPEYKPTPADINESNRNKLFQHGPANEEQLRLIIESCERENQEENGNTDQIKATLAIARYALGFILNNEKQNFKNAVELYDKVIESYPNWYEAYFNRAIAKIHLKKFIEAIDDFDKAEEKLNELPRAERASENIERELMYGKLLIFRSEARICTKDKDQLAIARDEILRSIIYLKGKGAQGDFWLSQISDRLKGTYLNADKNEKWFQFARMDVWNDYKIGFISAPILLLVLYVLLCIFKIFVNI